MIIKAYLKPHCGWSNGVRATFQKHNLLTVEAVSHSATKRAAVGSIQAAETLKVLTNVGTTLAGRLLLLDAQTMEWREIKLRKDPACPVCSGRSRDGIAHR